MATLIDDGGVTAGRMPTDSSHVVSSEARLISWKRTISRHSL
jgi:hypothetical protein